MPRKGTAPKLAVDRPAVTLVAPDESGTTTVHTTVAFNNLVYGEGYRPEGASVEEAYARLLGETTPEDDPPAMADTTEPSV
jgi:hypothetical protein